MARMIHRWSPRLATLFLGWACALLLAVQAANCVGQWSREPADVHAYRIAAEKMAGGVDPYVSVDGNRTLQYLYPPTFLMMFSPVLRVEGSYGLAWWAGLQIVMLAALARCLWMACAMVAKGKTDAVIVMAALLLFAPAWRNLVEGQISGMVALAMLAGVFLLEKGHPVKAGLMLALAAHFKVLPVIALPILLAQRRWQAAGAMAAWGLALIPLGAAWAQITGAMPGGISAAADLWWSWVSNMVAPVAVDPGSWIAKEYTPWNHSFVAALHRIFDPAVAQQFGWQQPPLAVPRWLLRAVAWLLGAAGIAATLRIAWKGAHHPAVRMGSFGLVWLMLNLCHAQTWTHHLLSFALLIPL
ncbi:MAG: DUF2029 domain-containing protein, partial [Akkermansiaceae bacterium]|nr:DUF2029 domain-containing protein [Akkermansiaceae bacterium]